MAYYVEASERDFPDWRQSRSMACIDGGYVYTNGNGTSVELDALLIPNVGGGGASSSFSSVLDVSCYSALSEKLL